MEAEAVRQANLTRGAEYKAELEEMKEMAAQQREEWMQFGHELTVQHGPEQAERTKEVNKAIDKSWATYDKHHQEMLNTAWQHYKFNAKMQLKYYKYSQEYRHGYWNNYGDPYGDVYGY